MTLGTETYRLTSSNVYKRKEMNCFIVPFSYVLPKTILKNLNVGARERSLYLGILNCTQMSAGKSPRPLLLRGKKRRAHGGSLFQRPTGSVVDLIMEEAIGKKFRI